MPDVPIVGNVVFFPLADYISIIIQNIHHIPVQVIDLVTVMGQYYARPPWEIVIVNIDRVQWDFESLVLHFSQIRKYGFIPGNDRQGPLKQQIIRHTRIVFKCPCYPWSEQTEIQASIIWFGSFPF